MIQVLALVLAAANATPSSPADHARRRPDRPVEVTRTPPAPPLDAPDGISCTPRLQDGGFEAGTVSTFWTQSSTNFGTPLCTIATCGDGGGTVGPRAGDWWSWFGGIAGVPEVGAVSQSAFLAGNAHLRFYLWIGARSGNGTDALRVFVDSTQVFAVTEATPGYDAYTLVDVDVTAFANNASHTVRFEGTTAGSGISNFSVDDVSLETCPGPALRIDDSSLTEGGPGSTTAMAFTISLTAQAASPVTVNWQTGNPPSGPVATPSVDYTASGGTVTFPPGTTAQTVNVPILGDALDEPDEGFQVSLTNNAGAIVADDHALGVIVDDDGPAVSIGDATVTEGNVGLVGAGFTVSLSSASVQPVTVRYATADGTATGGFDYLATSGVLTFAPGSLSQIVSVSVEGDLTDEPNETFTVELSNLDNASAGDLIGLGTIVDDDGAAIAVAGGLSHGFDRFTDLAATPAAARHLYVFPRPARTSWEVVVDAASGDLGTGTSGPVVQRLALDASTVLQSSSAVGVGPARTLIVANETAAPVTDYLEVRSDGCGTACGPDDVYRLRTRETTLTATRFNNSATQVTVVILQNPGGLTVNGTIWFWSPTGALLGTSPVALGARSTLVLNTTTVPALVGQGGSLTVTHDAPYGVLAGKAVALEPATGFSFDTPMEPRTR